MEKLTQEKRRLLGSLYNLSSEDSVILNNLKEEIASIDEDLRATKEEKTLKEASKSEVENKLDEFSNQLELFSNNFGQFDNSSFAALKAIDVDIQIGTITETINETSPLYIKDLTSQIDSYKVAINEDKERIKDLENTLEEKQLAYEEATNLKDKLKDLLDDIIFNNNTESYTRGFIRNILDSFNYFNSEDINKLEYLILFPENGLKDYNPNDEDEEAEDSASSTINLPEEPVYNVDNLNGFNEEKIENEENNEYDGGVTQEIPYIPDIKPIINIEAEEQMPIQDTIVPLVDEEVQSFSTPEEINIESPVIEIEDQKESYIEEPNNSLELKTKNTEILESIGLTENDVDEYFLEDKDLFQKITLLRIKGFQDTVIKRLIRNMFFRESLENIEEKISLLTRNGYALNEETVHLLNYDLSKFYSNISLLNDKGIEIDEKEHRNYLSTLSNVENIEDILTILKENNLSITKENGKHIINVFYQQPAKLKELITYLNDKSLSKVLTTTPEILEYNPDSIIKKIDYCLNNNIPLIDLDENTLYEYTYNQREFIKKINVSSDNEGIDYVHDLNIEGEDL